MCTVSHDTGAITARFHSRSYIKGLEPGRRIRLHGRVSNTGGQPTLNDPSDELLPATEGPQPAQEPDAGV